MNPSKRQRRIFRRQAKAVRAQIRATRQSKRRVVL